MKEPVTCIRDAIDYSEVAWTTKLQKGGSRSGRYADERCTMEYWTSNWKIMVGERGSNEVRRIVRRSTLAKGILRIIDGLHIKEGELLKYFIKKGKFPTHSLFSVAKVEGDYEILVFRRPTKPKEWIRPYDRDMMTAYIGLHFTNGGAIVGISGAFGQKGKREATKGLRYALESVSLSEKAT